MGGCQQRIDVMRNRLSAFCLSLLVACTLFGLLALPAHPVFGQTGNTMTPVALAQEPITAATANRIKQLARFGMGQASLLAWSPDGKTLAVGGSIGVWLYNTNSFDSAPRLLPSTSWCTALAFSADSTKLAAAFDGDGIHVIEVQTNKVVTGATRA
jgi:hypothetical protein